jgi:hypothetical protein
MAKLGGKPETVLAKNGGPAFAAGLTGERAVCYGNRALKRKAPDFGGHLSFGVVAFAT